MTIYKCPNCKKEFNRKCNFDYHKDNKKRPCSALYCIDNLNDENLNLNLDMSVSDNEIIINDKESTDSEKSQNNLEKIINETDNDNFEKIELNVNNVKNNNDKEIIINEKNTNNKSSNINELIIKDIDNLININIKKPIEKNTCTFCDKSFSQKSSLNRHLKDRCNSKKYYYEFEKLKDKVNAVICENENLKKKLNTQVNSINNSNNTSNTLNKNHINNGVINNNNNNNNNLNIQLVQFGNENIDELDIKEALDVYLRSTGGNIVSNILKYVNLNDKYPQNHNICITDLSRELVKIFNGKKFIIKKFKNIRGDILGKIIENIYKIVNKIQNNNNIKKTLDIKNKMKINDVSLKLINGYSGEEIVREEIKEKEKLLADKNNDKVYVIKDNKYNNDSDSDNDEERDFNLEEQSRIKHLDDKRDGLQEIAFERLKEELYNGKIVVSQ
jgi:hypothetical protein